ncbi:DUF1569 domain-containing protein [Cytophaga hutchinsonii]|uniref:DUF1569 domain-containing protein n=1 Tax=Cytophaga hutchinsonii (strain ATCC 33406 / DSM 1761 / CIP 103989 / NBRC 15051 / NCIMB 9469 / D465) TaxID=269798 RepID=A0A6N4SQY7_CYTH3|nr:DUF1569 domain-containing protein [Cytophaga hutchinsonii]ABG58698.1 hypothetical protein CHU_1427 [Cytophaga hutchinsonii ATCC 33406]SFX59834.1 Protein of unknown function [Cytophaga hutchinsonii ATCC 33406]
MKNIFTPEVTTEVIARINTLSPESKAGWGKMSINQMLAHCNVAYELVYEDKHPKPNVLMKFIIKLVAKDLVVNEKPYKKGAMTSPAFLIKDERNFEKEKIRLIDHIIKTQQLGESYFDNKESHSFGVLTKGEWNNMFYKHLDHHLNQFGA